MIRIKNILVPTDFSDFSKYALDYAIPMAQAFKANIILIHVTPEKELDSIRQISPYLEPGRIEELLKGRESEDRKKLDGFLPPEMQKGITAETIHKVGTPFLEIIKAAKQKEVDLIVMATHGRSGLSHILFGSVAEKVVRKSICPVTRNLRLRTLTIVNYEHMFVIGRLNGATGDSQTSLLHGRGQGLQAHWPSSQRSRVGTVAAGRA